MKEAKVDKKMIDATSNPLYAGKHWHGLVLLHFLYGLGRYLMIFKEA